MESSIKNHYHLTCSIKPLKIEIIPFYPLVFSGVLFLKVS
jgi:hypothetical protein